MLDCLDDLINQRGSVVDDLDDNIGRKRWLHRVESLLEVLCDDSTVLPHEHEGQPQHHFTVSIR